MIGLTKQGTMLTKDRKRIQDRIHAFLKPTYFDGIPLQGLFAILSDEGIDAIQEDGTPWAGILCGTEGRIHFKLALDDQLIRNTCLVLAWYKMASGRYEITGYMS